MFAEFTPFFLLYPVKWRGIVLTLRLSHVEQFEVI